MGGGFVLSGASNAGPGRRRDQISLYANDQFLTTVTDGAFADGLIGIYVGSRLTPNLTVVFDDITVYSINQ